MELRKKIKFLIFKKNNNIYNEYSNDVIYFNLKKLILYNVHFLNYFIKFDYVILKRLTNFFKSTF